MSDDLLFSAVYKLGQQINQPCRNGDHYHFGYAILTTTEAKALFDELPIPLKLAAWKACNDLPPEI